MRLFRGKRRRDQAPESTERLDAGAADGHLKDGFVALDGTVAIPIRFSRSSWSETGSFTSEGGVQRDKYSILYGHITPSATFAIPAQYREASDFSEGLARVDTVSGSAGYIDVTGEVVPASAWTHVHG